MGLELLVMRCRADSRPDDTTRPIERLGRNLSQNQQVVAILRRIDLHLAGPLRSTMSRFFFAGLAPASGEAAGRDLRTVPMESATLSAWLRLHTRDR